MTTTIALHPSAASTAAARPAAAAAAARVDLYATIHKALRSFMMDTLFRVGRIDVHDDDDVAATLGQLHQLLDLCSAHITHENQFVHAAIDARRADGAARTSAEHADHLHSIAALHEEAGALRHAAAGQRQAPALRLYRHLALFVAENFQHMHIEETVNNTLLWTLYSDAELIEILERIHAHVTPQQHLLVARWLVPAVSPMERSMILSSIKTQTPPEALLGVLASVRPHLDDRAWARLAPSLGVLPTLFR